ncbi:MAG: dihydrolipoyllysine-residue acetyltransferase [bacterium]|nr:dihydrolipoyllysine-residue acetyltransferase [bacterium]
MANEKEITVPDIGSTSQVDVIELLVKVGDHINIDTPLITLESDKASMEIPSPSEGIVTKINLKVGDKVSEGDVILVAQLNSASPATLDEPASEKPQEQLKQEEQVAESKSTHLLQLLDVNIPDIGGASGVDVIDILVIPGMKVEVDQSLVTLEGDKATMDIPSPYTGTVKEIKVHVGDKVSQGTLLLTMESSDTTKHESITTADTQSSISVTQQAPSPSTAISQAIVVERDLNDSLEVLSAGPAVRRMAREFGVDLTLVKGSGRKSRITTEDVQAYVKSRLSEQSVTNSAFSLPASPTFDFTKFGEVETKPLNKIKKVTGVNVHRSWITIPHVTQFDEADITDLEAFRKTETEKAKDPSHKLTLLAFVCQIVSKALQVYPQFNASLDSSGEHLIYKKYFNIGIAVETPNGLVVPVIKHVNQLSVIEIAKEMARLSTKARDKGLMPAEMMGGCFTISSLGGIGGTAFTPIVNSPEVAILGLSRSTIKPVYSDGVFKPRLMLPLSLSYDHRVIDGAEAARFTRYIGDCLSDIRKILL